MSKGAFVWECLTSCALAWPQKREVSLEILNYKKNGDKFWNLLSMMPVRNAAGAVVSFIGVQSDITELIRRKHAERELQQAKVQPFLPISQWSTPDLIHGLTHP